VAEYTADGLTPTAHHARTLIVGNPRFAVICHGRRLSCQPSNRHLDPLVRHEHDCAFCKRFKTNSR
jgi:hypothetical protein